MSIRILRPALSFPILVALLALAAPRAAHAHCDTLAGPVVADARVALEKGDVTPVLKWVRPADEAEIRQAFEQTLAVRRKGPEAKELADRYFFETLVRVHRAGEGAPFTGLKPGDAVEPIIALSDRSLESGEADALVKHVTLEASEGIRHRFARAVEARKHASESVEAGREYVEAYVDYTHYVERLAADATSGPDHHGSEAAAPHGH